MTIKASNIPGEFVLLAEGEFDKLDAAKLAAMAGSIAKDAIIEELQSDLAKYKNLFHDTEVEIMGERQDKALAMTEASDLSDELAATQKELADLRAELKHTQSTMMRRAISLAIKLDDAEAELAAIKPDWKDAPDEAYSLVGKWHWQSEKNAHYKPTEAGYIVVYRPEPTE